jgi:hypothetical protein
MAGCSFVVHSDYGNFEDKESLRAQVFSQLGENLVLALRLGQPEVNGLQISIDKFKRIGWSAHKDSVLV